MTGLTVTGDDTDNWCSQGAGAQQSHRGGSESHVDSLGISDASSHHLCLWWGCDARTQGKDRQVLQGSDVTAQQAGWGRGRSPIYALIVFYLLICLFVVLGLGQSFVHLYAMLWWIEKVGRPVSCYFLTDTANCSETTTNFWWKRLWMLKSLVFPQVPQNSGFSPGIGENFLTRRFSDFSHSPKFRGGRIYP